MAQFPRSPREQSEVAAVTRVSIGRRDHRPFTGATLADPVGRLARLDPGTGPQGSLVRVHPGDLSGVPRLYVFVHGWTPGSAAVADLLFAERGTPAKAWDDGIADMSGIPLVSAYQPLLAALARRDPRAGVLWFSWVDQSATPGEVLSARESLRFTEINGRRLAAALVLATSSGSTLAERSGALPPTQLIGHSHGCVVATHAALALPSAPAQLTLLDCPEDWVSRAGGAAGLLADLLPRLEPGREPGRVFIDSYSSMFGLPYHHHLGLSDVVDVRLAAPIRLGDDRGAVGFAHEYAVNWYTESVGRPDPHSGYGWSLLAPRTGAPVAAAATEPAAQQPMAPFDPGDLASAYFVVAHNRPIETAARAAADAPGHTIRALDVGELRLSPDQPDVAIGVRLAGTHLVEFEYQITDPGPYTRIEAAVNRVLVFSGSAGAIEVPERGRYLRIPPSPEPQAPTLLQFRLMDPGPGTSATIRSLQAVGSPRAGNYDLTGTSWAIAGLGFLAGSITTGVLVAAVGAARRALGARGQ